MTPREPDRFDALLGDWDRRFNHPASNRSTFDRADLLAYLRAAESSALERAAQAVEDTEIVRRGALTYEPWDDAQATLSNATKAIRALIPPAAAPAVKRCGATNDNDRAPSVCVLPKWHPGNHYETNVASWSSEHAVETRKAQEADLRDQPCPTTGCHLRFGHGVAHCYATPAPAQGADLERKARAWTAAIEYCEEMFSPEWLADPRNRGIFAARIYKLLNAARAAPPKGEGKT